MLSNDLLLHLNKPINIKDLVVVPQLGPPSFTACGEFDAKVEKESRLDRLYQTIQKLVEYASEEHQKANCDKAGNLLPEKENDLTRLITSEFSFFTKTPLFLEEFNTLQQKIMDLAKRQPSNLHLVLSSFAVRTPDNKVMNVVPYFECGKEAHVHFIVKNDPSIMDPIYEEKTDEQKKSSLPNVNAAIDRVDHLTVKIDNVLYPFSFNNVFECITAGGNKFFSCVEICRDHCSCLGRRFLDFNLDCLMMTPSNIAKTFFSTQCSHIVTSSSVSLNKEYLLCAATHADPIWSESNKKEDYANNHGSLLLKEIGLIPAQDFGRPWVIWTPLQSSCQKLPTYELEKVNYYNNLLLEALQPADHRKQAFLPQFTEVKNTLECAPPIEISMVSINDSNSKNLNDNMVRVQC